MDSTGFEMCTLAEQLNHLGSHTLPTHVASFKKYIYIFFQIDSLAFISFVL